MQVTIDARRSTDGRLEGTVVTEAGTRYGFTGTLDLLRILEQLDLDAPAPRPNLSGDDR